MGSTNSSVTRPDGSLDWSQGVDSLRTPTSQSQNNPNGLPKNALAWLRNGTVRGGGISQRPGWLFNRVIHDNSGLFQGGYMYQPDVGDPYLVCSISGHIYKVPLDPSEPVVDLSQDAFQENPFIVPRVPYVVLQNLNTPQLATTFDPGAPPAVATTDPYVLLLPTLAPATPSGITGWIDSADVQTPNVIRCPPLGQNVTASLSGFFAGNVGDEIKITYKVTVTQERHAVSYSSAITVRNDNCPMGAEVVQLARWTQAFQTKEFYGNKTGSYEVTDFPHQGFIAPAIGATVDVVAYWEYYDAAFDKEPKVGDEIYFDYLFKVVAFNTDPSLVDTSALSLQYNPADEPHAYFQQAEQFLVIQAGDGQTLPLIWDGERLFRSLGINDSALPIGDVEPGINQIPPATAMDYFMGRLWYAQGGKYAAGDIVGNVNSGSSIYNYRDSVINVTENPLALGGDGFVVPDNAGNIRAISHSTNINTTLGQGQLYIFTRKSIYALTVPVTRDAWIAADNDTGPVQTVVQIDNGSVGDRCIVSVNGDLFYQSFDPAIRSITVAVRNFGQWGNVPISSNEFRVLQQIDRGLMSFASGIEFDSRLLQCTMPTQLPQGVVYQGIIPLDFVPLSTLQQQMPPVWEGIWDGLDILQLYTGDFGGRHRAFAANVSREDGSIGIWEISTAEHFDKVDTRVNWSIEFPALTWGDEFALKRLLSAELWVDRISGQVLFEMDYRPDGETCWTEWHKWLVCTPRDSRDLGGPSYPIVVCGPCYAATMTLPVPPVACESCDQARPSDIAYQHQLRLTLTGWCRIRGLLAHAAPVERKLYEGKVC